VKYHSKKFRENSIIQIKKAQRSKLPVKDIKFHITGWRINNFTYNVDSICVRAEKMLVDGSSTNHTLDRNLYTAVNSCEKLRAKIHVEKSDALDRNSINPIYMG